MPIDAELSWIDSYEDVAAMQEELLAVAFQAVADKHGDEIKELFDIDVVVPTVPFSHPARRGAEIVKARGQRHPAHTDGDLDPEGERQISAHVQETYGHQFVFISPITTPEIRLFYHMRNARRADRELRPALP
ncbi:MAG: hypothetical protein R2692_05545 [Microbacterium sp.]